MWSIWVTEKIFTNSKARGCRAFTVNSLFTYCIKNNETLTFIYLDMPKISKSIDELENRFEKLMFVIKNLSKLDRVPETLREKIFLKLFEKAGIAKFNQDEYMQYEESLKYYRDLKNSLDTAREEGREEGLEKGREVGLIEGEKRKQIEIARKLKALGMTNEEIENITGLQRQDLDEL